MTCKKLKTVAFGAALMASMASAQAGDLLVEGFDNVAALQTRGWLNLNFSTLPSGPGFGQGDSSGVDGFAAQAGGPDSYAYAGWAINEAVDSKGKPTGEIVADLLTPVLALDQTVSLSFYTRTAGPSRFADRLTVGVLIGSEYSELLSINFSLLRGGYPLDWTQYTVGLGGQGAGATGRFVFEYYLPDAAVAGNYIGLDTVSVQVVPEPGTWLMMGLGLAGLSLLRRRSA